MSGRQSKRRRRALPGGRELGKDQRRALLEVRAAQEAAERRAVVRVLRMLDRTVDRGLS